jgi:Sulfotransferase family
MIYCPSHKLIILLPWKCASQTLRARLRAINRSPYPEFFHFNPILNRVVHQHLTLADFMTLPESRQGFRVATFVRNPYDRVVSAWRQLIVDVGQQPGRRFEQSWIRDLVTQQLADNFALLCKAQFAMEPWFLSLPAYQILEAGRDTSLPLHPAHYHTHLGRQQVASFIGRVEYFETDFAALCRVAGIDSPGTETVNRSADSSAPDLQGYRYAGRLQPQTIARIEELFAEDFERFGYPRLSQMPERAAI